MYTDMLIVDDLENVQMFKIKNCQITSNFNNHKNPIFW